MTPKLTDRLARLEAASAADAAAVPIPPEIAGAYLRAVAIGLGGFPRPPETTPPYRPDSISDGLARGLGYRDRDEMEARIEADPDEWQERMAGAEAVLTARYVKDPEGEGTCRGPTFQFMVGVLEEIGHAKAAKLPGTPHHWPAEHPRLDRSAKSIRRALGLFGIVTDGQIAEACT